MTQENAWFDGGYMFVRLGSLMAFQTLQTTSEFLLHANKWNWTHLWRGRIDETMNPSKMSTLLESTLSVAVQVFVVSMTREICSSEIEVLPAVMQKVLAKHRLYSCR